MKRPLRPLVFAFLGFAVTALSATFVQGTEDRAAKRYRAAERLGDRVKTADPSRVDPALEGQLVRLEGMATADGILEDPDVGVRAPGLLLSRSVEMWIWQETLAADGTAGDEVTYEQGWSDELVDSSSFVVPEGHQNPATPRLPPEVWTQEVRVGDHVVPDRLVRTILKRQPVAVTSTEALPASLRPASIRDGVLYVSESPDAPQVGDLRVSYEVVEPLEVSLLGVQQGNTLTHYGPDKKPRLLVLKIEDQPLFPYLDGISPAQIWLYRALSLAGLVLGLALLRSALPEALRPGLAAVVLLALTAECAVAAVQWPEISMARVWAFGAVAAASLVAALWRLRR